MDQIYFKTRQEWREWLSQNHDKCDGILLVFYKKHTGKISVDYDAAVEEALCFGWIDSIIKRLDDERYTRKFTPRKPKSIWSKLNKERVQKLIENGIMTKVGLAKITEAKASGYWEKPPQSQTLLKMPPEFIDALEKNATAKINFNQLTASYRKQFIGWIASAKRQDTRDRRISEALDLLEKGQKLGMK